LGRSACAANRRSCIGSIRLRHVLVLQGGCALGGCQAGLMRRTVDQHGAELDMLHGVVLEVSTTARAFP
jgi:hypothetical protein